MTITRLCPNCKAMTPYKKAENRIDSPYICECCGHERANRIIDELYEKEKK